MTGVLGAVSTDAGSGGTARGGARTATQQTRHSRSVRDAELAGGTSSAILRSVAVGTATDRAALERLGGALGHGPISRLFVRSGGAIVPLGIRTLRPLADGVVTAYISPWIEP